LPLTRTAELSLPTTAVAALRVRIGAFVELTKPGIVRMVLVTGGAGFFMGSRTASSASLRSSGRCSAWASPRRAPARSTSSWSVSLTGSCAAPQPARCRRADSPLANRWPSHWRSRSPA
jgi:hypothetical protein